MYCPECRTRASTDQKFCRGCGASLAAVSRPQPVADVTPYTQSPGIRVEVSDERHKYTRLGFTLFWGGILLGALIGIVGDAMETFSWRLGHFIQHLAGLGGLVLLAGLGFMIYSRFFAPKGLGSPHPAAIPPAPASLHRPGGHPPSSFDSREPARAPSVTEHTTYTLDSQKPDKLRQ